MRPGESIQAAVDRRHPARRSWCYPHQTPIAAADVVTRNVFADNNRPNSGPDSETGDLVPGIGVVIDGADRTLLSHNVIARHQLFGLTLIPYCITQTATAWCAIASCRTTPPSSSPPAADGTTASPTIG